jgi:hypothetical protein
LLVLVVCVNTVAAREGKYTLKEAEVAVPMQVKEPTRSLLHGKALQVLNEKGDVHCEVWLRKSVPAKATDAQIQNGLTYQELAQTTLLGVIRFPNAIKDYRNQDVDPGVYTLRLAMQPQDGDHMGTAPHPEFCLISNPEFDPKPDVMEPKALQDVSARTMSGSHPGIFLLFPNNKPAEAATIADQGQGHWVVKARLEVDAGGKKAFVGFALTVVGHSSAAN